MIIRIQLTISRSFARGKSYLTLIWARTPASRSPAAVVHRLMAAELMNAFFQRGRTNTSSTRLKLPRSSLLSVRPGHTTWSSTITRGSSTRMVRIAKTSDPAIFSLNFMIVLHYSKSLYKEPPYIADISANHALISASFSAPNTTSATTSLALGSRSSFCCTPSTEGSK